MKGSDLSQCVVRAVTIDAIIVSPLKKWENIIFQQKYGMYVRDVNCLFRERSIHVLTLSIV